MTKPVNDRKTTYVSFRLEQSKKDRLKKLAADHGMTISEYVTAVLGL